ncbi:hypothetical protein C8J57DRAFT_20069 [Mycena rebaudengoi]|nr:hypothetical protein C8J57DRAFT_20069 [Mycena rebaudengoi]
MQFTFCTSSERLWVVVCSVTSALCIARRVSRCCCVIQNVQKPKIKRTTSPTGICRVCFPTLEAPRPMVDSYLRKKPFHIFP